MKSKSEDKLQQEIFTYFNNKYCLKFHNPSLIIHSTPNGGYRNVVEAIKMKSTGILSGIADLTIKGCNSYFVDVEIKLPGEKQSKNQIEIQEKLKKLNANYIVVYSLLDFQMQIEKFLPKLLCR